MSRTFWTQEVNFIVSVVFVGSCALLSIVAIYEADERENPIANLMAHSVLIDEVLTE